jgi:predicted transglutaminase-like cysteine proteinase
MSTEFNICDIAPTRRPIAPLIIAAIVGIIMSFSNVTNAWAVTSPLMNGRQSSSSDLSAFTKWTSVLPRYEEQRAEADDQCFGKGCLNQKWEDLLISLEGKPVAVQVEAVNRFFNKIRYIEDTDNYGVSDYWQTPYEMFERGGDCEDYAIGKYISLKRLGVAEEDMNLVIVRDRQQGGIVHAMLEVKVGGDIKLLDNQAGAVKSIASVFRYTPVFAINEHRWWAYN